MLEGKQLDACISKIERESDSMKPLSVEEFARLAENCDQMGVDAIWHEIAWVERSTDWAIRFGTFQARKEAFFWVMEELVHEGRILLTSNDANGELKLPPNELLIRLREVFPLSDEDLLSGAWFYTNSCPVGMDWVHSDPSA